MSTIVIELDEADRAKLEAIASEEHQPLEVIVRDAVRLFLSRTDAETAAQQGEDYLGPDRLPRRFAIDGIFSGDGRSIRDIPEEELLEGFGDDAWSS